MLAVRKTSATERAPGAPARSGVLFPFLAVLILEGLDRLDLQWFQVDQEDPSAVAAGVTAAAGGRIAKLGYA